jgi:rfaE bifunctional protein nucleotidyltransferase chain/domain
MEFIERLIEENNICNNSSLKLRENSEKINYLNKVNDKPWGKEYLAYQNSQIGIWILHVNKDQETSLHCHFKKDTILMNVSGVFKINFYNSYKILNLFECIYVPRNTFHGIHSYSEDGILMEIEVYTTKIQYTDKNDLLRIKDMYNRDKTKYETSVKERDPQENEIMNFHIPNKYKCNGVDFVIIDAITFEGLHQYDKIIMLDGCAFIDGKRITAGSLIDLSKQYSLLSDSVTILCLSNLNYKYLNKIIYSKSHLIDYINSISLNNVGLTSGCFDIVHEGHIANLKRCKQNCDNLFVCLSSDTQIKNLKGDLRPINNINDRINMLINFDFIDKIILYEETDYVSERELDNIMNIINPTTWFKGTDYTKEDIFKKHPSLKNIKLIDLMEGKSTTNIINKILN